MRVRVMTALACAVAAAATASSAAAQLSAHGKFINPFNANESTNWYGYNQGTLEKNRTMCDSITGDLTDPTADRIQETPLVFSTGGAGLAALPNLSTNTFSAATVNGKNAGLKASEAIDLVNSNGHVIALPSAPNATLDGFNLCTWATTC